MRLLPEPGFYWIYFDDEWTVVEVRTDLRSLPCRYMQIVGSAALYYEGDFQYAVLGPRLDEPPEPSHAESNL